MVLGERRWRREAKSQKLGLGTLLRGITGVTARAVRSGQPCERPRNAMVRCVRATPYLKWT